jgi:hypothetical protein
VKTLTPPRRPAWTDWTRIDGARVDKIGVLALHPAMPLSRYFLLLAMVWMVAMTWRIYPQFGDGLRIDGRVTTIEDYVNDTCSQRVGPAAQTCLAEASGEAQILLQREQGKSVLLISMPILLYFLVYLPRRLIGGGAKARRDANFAAALLLGAALWTVAAPNARAQESMGTSPGTATNLQQQDSAQKWRVTDDCARTAFAKFPDYTPESNARRENYRRACLRINGLPAPDGPAAVRVQSN